jgi:hypothetical protein
MTDSNRTNVKYRKWAERRTGRGVGEFIRFFINDTLKADSFIGGPSKLPHLACQDKLYLLFYTQTLLYSVAHYHHLFNYRFRVASQHRDSSPYIAQLRCHHHHHTERELFETTGGWTQHERYLCDYFVRFSAQITITIDFPLRVKNQFAHPCHGRAKLATSSSSLTASHSSRARASLAAVSWKRVHPAGRVATTKSNGSRRIIKFVWFYK